MGSDVFTNLNPAQTIIKIVKDEMTILMGGETCEIDLNKDFTTLMMIGLQGAGKTTTASKLAAKFKAKGKKPLLVACDIYRPAAIEQLKVNASKVGVDVYEEGKNNKPFKIVLNALEYAKKNGYNLMIIDTAGRLQIDDFLMEELMDIKDNVKVDKTILVVDAMAGQEAINVAQTFDDQIVIDGTILTKLDGDSRGGAALSIRSVTNKPIFYVGMGEKLSDLEQFYPDRMANRILGMGDVLTLIDKLQEEIDIPLEEKPIKKDFDLEDFLDSFKMMNKMGGFSSILGFMPNMKGIDMSNIEIDEKQLKRTEAIILYMTKKERQNPDILNASRKRRIANGAGVTVQEVNILIKNFERSKDMMKQFNMKGNKKMKKKFPFGF